VLGAASFGLHERPRLVSPIQRPTRFLERLGHSSIQVTLDVYGHIFPSLEEQLAERLDVMARDAAAAYLPPERRPMPVA
jgi:hypothetical protein